MKKSYFLFLAFLLTLPVFSQQNVTGVVTSSENNEPIIGASVTIKGTTRGASTNLDGHYSIQAEGNQILVVSYVGMETQEIPINNRTVINIVLVPRSEVLEEVVVTAMGIQTEKKKLNFAVESLNSDQLTAGESQNFVNSLQGKIAGITVTSAGGSPNSGSRLQIRAISSINPSQSNQPLFIIDGMPSRGNSTNMIDINSNDIENVTVLKGAAAAALYGQEAANGAVMITTKSGKSGKLTTSLSAGVELAEPVRLPKIQRIYGPGARGVTRKFSGGGWGPLLGPGETVYDNIGAFLQTGVMHRYNANVSGGSDRVLGYASLNSSFNQGIVPNDYNNKYSLLLKLDAVISQTVKASLQTNTIVTKSRGFGNAMSSIYNWPINDDLSWYEHKDGRIRWRHNPDEMNNSEKLGNSLSPLWGRYKDSGQNNSTRNILVGSLTWTPVNKLDLTAKVSSDASFSSSESWTVPRYARSDFDYTSASEDPLGSNLYLLGSYYLSQGRGSLLAGQLLGTYEWAVTDNMSLNLLLGGELKTNKGLSSVLSGDEFRIPGAFYSYMNIVSSELRSDRSVGHSVKNNAGLFSELRFDYKSLLQLSATYRRDFSSALSIPYYDYYSFTGGVIFSELFGLRNDIFSYGKLRGNWAGVGKDTGPYRLRPRFTIKSTFPDPGYAIDPTLPYANILEPEMTKSWEIGADLRFFKNKTLLDIAYYSTTVYNQIVTVRVSPASGNILQVRNEGAVKNHGLEISLGQEFIKNRDFSWNGKLNFSLNRGKVISLPDQLTELQAIQYTDIFTTAYLHGPTTAISGLDYKKTDDGRVIIDNSGYPVANPAKGNLIGNREPDFLMGYTNELKYKGLLFSFLLDGRKGGDVANLTGRGLLGTGMSRFHETYRNREFIFDGVVQQPDGTYIENTKPVILTQQVITNYISGISSNFIEDGSYIRLSYVTLGWDLSRLIKGSVVKSLNVSFTGRNLFLLTKYTGSDPQINASVDLGGAGAAGVDNYPVPNTRDYIFTVNATF